MTKKGFKVGYVLHIPDFFESIDCTKLATRITKKNININMLCLSNPTISSSVSHD